MSKVPEDDDLNAFLHARLRRIVSDPHTIEDLTQEAWLVMLRHSGASWASSRSWLGTVAHNLALQALRSEGRRRKREQASARREDEEPASVDTDRIEKIQVAFGKLREPYRIVLRLRFFEDVPPTMIAERLGSPIETARTRLRRGLEQLRKNMFLESPD